MGSKGTTGTDRRRFVVAVTLSCLVFLAVGRLWGEEVALRLQETPTTTNGWLFIGWLIAGPPYLVAMLVWHERRRLRPRQRQVITYLLAIWIGLSMFVLPARLDGAGTQFGRAALVGDPLSVGWAWGALSSAVGFAFTALVLAVLHTSVPGRPSVRQRDLTVRFLERAWMVLLIASLGFALYGQGAGVFNSGT